MSNKSNNDLIDSSNSNISNENSNDTKSDSDNSIQGIKILKISGLKFVLDSNNVRYYIKYCHHEPTPVENIVMLLNFNVDIKNETPNRITKFDMEEYIEVDFQGSEPKRKIEITMDSPSPGKNKEESGYCILWQPYSVHKLNFICYGSQIHSYYDKLSLDYFERTPVHCDIVFKYKAISVDGEYNDEFRYDILDKWKEFQTVLGLR